MEDWILVCLARGMLFHDYRPSQTGWPVMLLISMEYAIKQKRDEKAMAVVSHVAQGFQVCCELAARKYLDKD
ncbi:uncharacterized protein JCM15063_006250 [Sporobolomyces koalae]|uniref:uncharacterized protein n=1 Tax=Sporobolomyces koalae TaxID=500713 RepID=UPI0031711359